jgi:hypothetical protein
MSVAIAVAGVIAVAAAACSGGSGGSRAASSGDDATTTEAPPRRPTAAELCAGAAAVEPSPAVAQPAVTEASGLAASEANAGVVWTHNDSGGAPEVFAIGVDDGADRGRFTLGGASAIDWEDMARGPGPDGGPDVLYLADIGDNMSVRSSVAVYRAPEPTIDPAAPTGTIAGVDALTLTYPDGAHDAEALLADPVTGDLFVVTKAWDGAPAGAYRIPADVGAGAPAVMARDGDVAVAAGQLVTGGDVAADGSIVALRTYTDVLLWDRADGQSVAEALAGTPCSAPAPAEIQGEAVALDPDGRGYVTLGEGLRAPLHRFRLP